MYVLFIFCHVSSELPTQQLKTTISWYLSFCGSETRAELSWLFRVSPACSQLRSAQRADWGKSCFSSPWVVGRIHSLSLQTESFQSSLNAALSSWKPPAALVLWVSQTGLLTPSNGERGTMKHMSLLAILSLVRCNLIMTVTSRPLATQCDVITGVTAYPVGQK